MANFVFVHGGGQGGWVWQDLVDALGRALPHTAVNTLALDIPGCGSKRGQDTSAMGFEDLLDELLAEITASGLRDCVLVGHSQAGTVLPYLYQRQPGLFRHLVYVSCSLPLPGQTVGQMMGSGTHGEHADQVGWAAGLRTDKPIARNRYLFCNDMSEEQYQRYRQQLGRDQWPVSSYTKDDWPLLQDQPPATYAACTLDNILPLAWQHRFAQRFGASRIIELEAGHQVMTTQPAALARALITTMNGELV
ncbi:alpha/beta fold hydrolase [Pseudomaricurvus sp. HS19]|uniref:alpha/beta fold hydrolase n=1 Tax=Pseudomaricurvus sp. HS19 TaxID=2692626 RepID=UPI001369C598|nr:alpha/beta hydrolase [Pseudomaricurvus sp. HS19]MYM62370.1 alpha/beta fold hydrolase [Pseudomaricurvus sp. HS19]